MSTHKEYALIAILATIAVIGVVPAFAYCPPECAPKADYFSGNNVTQPIQQLPEQILPIVVSTDKAVYDHQSTIVVSGHVLNPYPGQAVTMRVSDPIGNVVSVNQLTVDNNGNFVSRLNTSSPLWASGGVYTIYVQYGAQQGLRTAQVQFTISGGGATSCDPSQLLANLNGQVYCIDYQIDGATVTGVALNTASTSLVVNINANNDGQIILNIPRNVLDAKSGVKDTSFFVLVDGQENNQFTETTNSTTRTVTIPFVAGSEKIEVIGTQIVPEFGPIAALVLAIAIISIMAVSAKTGLRLMPKY